MPAIPYKWKALLTVAMGTMTATMDASITTIAFPELTRVFQTDLATVMWIAVAYILVSSSLMLIFGKISDFIGRTRIYTVGMAVFTLGMAACALSQNVEQIIIFRIIQALGAAMSISCGTAIVTEAFPATETGKGLGMLSMSVSAGFILGPIIGGFLLDWLDWRSLFYMRTPIGICTFLMAMALLKKDEGRSGKIKLDIIGTLTSSAGLFCLIFGMAHIKSHGLMAPVVLLFVGSGFVILFLFILVERRATDPIIDLALFKNRTFSYAMGGLLLFFLAVPPYILIMPFYLMEGINLSPLESGMLLAVVSMVTMITSPISGAFSDRFGPVWPSVFGAAATAAAFFFMLGFDLQTEIPTIILILILLGLGVGAFQPPNNSTIMGAVERKRLGSASALIATERQVGISLGMALAGAIFSTRQSMYQDILHIEGWNAAQAIRRSIPPAYQDVLLISVFLALGAMGFALLSAGKKTKKKPKKSVST
ncbi:MAG: MFS transporter [Deltaproteobacteria bacterium]|nr:MFS transporter [Deltaproteobacteria bacterium]